MRNEITSNTDKYIFDTIPMAEQKDSSILIRNYNMMWLDLKLNLGGNALAIMIQQDKEKSELLKHITHMMEHMELDDKYMNDYPPITKLLESQYRKDGGMRALSWFSWNFRHFHRNEGLEWEDAFAKAIDRTIEQIDEHFQKEIRDD